MLVHRLLEVVKAFITHAGEVASLHTYTRTHSTQLTIDFPNVSIIGETTQTSMSQSKKSRIDIGPRSAARGARGCDVRLRDYGALYRVTRESRETHLKNNLSLISFGKVHDLFPHISS